MVGSSTVAEQVAPGESAGAAVTTASERTAGRDVLSFRTGADPRAIVPPVW